MSGVEGKPLEETAGLPSEETPGLPQETFTRWASAKLPQLGDAWRAEVISGGLSNLTYRVRGEQGTVIVRRPPLGKLLPSAHDMAREHRVLSALQGTDVPVPRVLALCDDPEVAGAPFYVMAEVDGVVFREPEQTARLSAEQRRDLADDLVEVLARIQAVDLEATGLADFGRHGGYVERQLRRWTAQWEASRTREVAGMPELLTALARQQPHQAETTLVHGDYRLDNTIISTDETPRVAAVVDWELSTLGDPLADLATWLTYWSGPGEDGSAVPVAQGLTDLAGFPTGDEIAERYAARTGRDLSHLAFYRAFTDWRLAVILEGVHARYLAGKSLGEGYDRVGPAVPLLVDRALAHLA
ncbi:phosphotransferase family protein [Phycicoccus sp. SLBN-51]|uniref:phosphotransferase family protein n=1 Tax=Phycicoccus sp. SLBN-51 TaxID=2768447 RepID=UPI001153B959|nr:phosphotransferase family protein [Phycicoccus sp. SLBN-51]TQJ49100.1 aminoglycoside phosphotransferase (APT) family kinase protein [Phycicoccus sp. SLBN-51]